LPGWPDRPRSRTSRTGHKNRRQRVLKRDGYQFQLRYPGCEGRATIVDHIVALALGGADTDTQTQAVCDHCHRAKTSREGHLARGHRVTPPG
jgi:5-methylcytosine-specific restriction protein A